MAKELPGRTENSVKNRFYSTVRKLIADVEVDVEVVIDKNTNQTIIQNMIRKHLDKTKNSEAAANRINYQV